MVTVRYFFGASQAFLEYMPDVVFNTVTFR